MRIRNGNRVVEEVPFGYAAYEGKETDGVFKGRHVGILGSQQEATSWLETGEPEPKPIHSKSPEQT